MLLEVFNISIKSSKTGISIYFSISIIEDVLFIGADGFDAACVDYWRPVLYLFDACYRPVI